MNTKFIPCEKMSKKQQKEMRAEHRKPPIPPSKIADDVYRYKQKKREQEEAIVDDYYNEFSQEDLMEMFW